MGSLFSREPTEEEKQAKDLAEREAFRRMQRERAMRPVTDRGATCFKQLRMSDELLAWILDDPEFKPILGAEIESVEEVGERWAFKRAIDYPSIPEHVYFEGYGHAGASSDAIASMNPRFGSEMAKQRGPRRLVSFIRCFKRVNASWIQEAFREESSFRELLRADLHLCDLAMQLHGGEGVSGDHLGWHVDGPNSALHMAVSLLGTRSVHTNSAEQGHQEHREAPGDVYIGTPFTVVHAVEYPEAPLWASKVVAVQVRFLFPTEGFHYTRTDYAPLMDHVCSVVSSAHIVMPTLHQVQAFDQEFEFDQ